MSSAINARISQYQQKIKRTSHVLHLILSVVTLGLWLFVWPIVALSNGLENAKTNRAINRLIAQIEEQERRP